jgi:acyl-CoA thioesterase I
MNPKNRIILAVTVVILLLALSLTVVFLGYVASMSASDKLVRVACLGDSITELTDYPADLQVLLGNSSTVGNFGASGTNVILDSGSPYYHEPAFDSAKSFEPTTVIIMLGTNDARTNVYQQIINFVADYQKLITSIQGLNSKPQIFIVTPPPIFSNTLGVNGTIFAQGIIPRIQQVASQQGLPVIDVYNSLLNHPECFRDDGVHPDSEGAQIIANTIYDAIWSNSTGHILG